jgi:geranylgeranyl diphosphate synthase type II
MILASVQVGARFGGAKETSFRALTRFGERIGLAFQIVDDILDVEGEVQILGKTPGSDLSKKKVTYPSIIGMEESKKRARELVELALEALDPFGKEAESLREIGRFIVARNY